jgi:hypothetical protein
MKTNHPQFYRYIIDNYDNLPDIVIFVHGRRYQWHNEDPLYGMFTRYLSIPFWHAMLLLGCTLNVLITDYS